MKILFLDIDGVLNSEESFHLNHQARCDDAHRNGRDGASFKPEFCWPLGHLHTPLIARLNQIMEDTGCFIVLSSSWRIICDLPDLRGWMKQKGFEFGDRMIDKTDNDPQDARGGQIQRWLDAHPEVTAYAILDDDSEDIVGTYTTKHHHNNFVHTPFMYGLQDEQVGQVFEILNRRNKSLTV